MAKRSFIWNKQLQVIASSEFWSHLNYRPGRASCELSQVTMTRVASCSMGATSISSVVAVGILSLQRTLSRCNSCTGSVAIRHKGFPKKIQKHPANHKHPKDQSIPDNGLLLATPISLNTQAWTLVTAAPATNAAVRGWGRRHGCLGGSACTCQLPGFWFGWPSLHLEVGLRKKCWVLGNWLI